MHRLWSKISVLAERLWLHPKLIVNTIYSFFVNLFYSFTSFFKFKIIADFGSTISKSVHSKLIIDKRLYLGGKYIGDMSKQKSSIMMYKGSTFHVKGRVKLGPGVGIVTARGANLSIGDNTYITANSVLYCASDIEIGSDCAIAWNTTIMDTDFHHITYSDGSENAVSKPIKIGNKVWIGCNTIIMKGVTIGDNVVVGANTLVNKDIPANSLAIGNPMRITQEDIDWHA